LLPLIAGPVHINKNHRALLFVSIRTHTVLYIVSRGESNETRNKVLKNWSTFTKYRSDMKQTEWIMASYDHVVQLESDNSNCGVFLCYFFKQLLKQDVALFTIILICPCLDQKSNTQLKRTPNLSKKQTTNKLLNKTLKYYSLFLLFLKFINFCVFGRQYDNSITVEVIIWTYKQMSNCRPKNYK